MAGMDNLCFWLAEILKALSSETTSPCVFLHSTIDTFNVFYKKLLLNNFTVKNLGVDRNSCLRKNKHQTYLNPLIVYE